MKQYSYSSKLIDLLNSFLKLGFTSFGGPVAHIGYFHNEFVQKKKWLSDSQFSQVLAICQFLPGPASSQLGFAIGLMRAGWVGAILAFLAFTLPSAILLIVFAQNLHLFESQIGQSIIHGLKLVAVVVVFDAVLGMSQKLCVDHFTKLIAVISACVLLLLPSITTQMFIILMAGLAGLIFIKKIDSSGSFSQPQSQSKSNPNSIALHYSSKVGFILISIFSLLLLLSIFYPAQSILMQIANIFYFAGSSVFGGGHVVLPLLQSSVVDAGLVSQSEFLAGYGASQAVPGPMFTFAAFLGAVMDSSYSSITNAVVALCFMFIPGFLLIAGVLPFWQTLSKYPAFLKSITAINAAVVGILGAALYDPIFTSSVTNATDFVLVILGVAILRVLKLSAIYLVGFAMIASIIFSII